MPRRIFECRVLELSHCPLSRHPEKPPQDEACRIWAALLFAGAVARKAVDLKSSGFSTSVRFWGDCLGHRFVHRRHPLIAALPFAMDRLAIVVSACSLLSRHFNQSAMALTNFFSG